jgi:hypothetical protein
MATNPFDATNRAMCKELGASQCPFCGGDPQITGGGQNYWHVTCRECFGEGPMWNSAEGAVAAWNRRPDDARLASAAGALLAALKGILQADIRGAVGVGEYMDARAAIAQATGEPT